MSGSSKLDVNSLLGMVEPSGRDRIDDSELDIGVVDCDEAKSDNKTKEMVLRFQSAYLKQIKEEHNLRKRFVPYVYWLVVGLLLATFLLLLVNGIVSACGRKFLSDKILMALMGSTLADIVGILYIAVKWLFVSSVRR